MKHVLKLWQWFDSRPSGRHEPGSWQGAFILLLYWRLLIPQSGPTKAVAMSRQWQFLSIKPNWRHDRIKRNCNDEFKKMLNLLISKICINTRCNSPGGTVSNNHRELVFQYNHGAFSWRSLGHLGREKRTLLATFLLCSKTPCGSSCHHWGQWCLQGLLDFSHLCLRLQVCMAEQGKKTSPHRCKICVDTFTEASLLFNVRWTPG